MNQEDFSESGRSAGLSTVEVLVVVAVVSVLGSIAYFVAADRFQDDPGDADAGAGMAQGGGAAVTQPE